MRYTKLISLLLITVFSACSSSKKLSKKGGDEKAFVSYFLQLMVDSDKVAMKLCLSPKYMEEANPPDSAEINTFAIVNFKIEDYEQETGYVSALVWGKSKEDWTHRLTFKVVKENKKLYLWSDDTNFDNNYIDPWIVVEYWVNEKK